MLNKELQDISKKFKGIVESELLKFQEDITGFSYRTFKNELIKSVIDQEAKAKEKGEKFDDILKSDKYLTRKTEEAFKVAVGEYLKDNGLMIDFKEDYKDGKSVIKFSVYNNIREDEIEIGFKSSLELGKKTSTINEVDNITDVIETDNKDTTDTTDTTDTLVDDKNESNDVIEV